MGSGETGIELEPEGGSPIHVSDDVLELVLALRLNSC